MSGDYYSVQNLFPFIGATIAKGVATLTPITLTAATSANRKEIDVDGMQQVILYIKYTTGAGGSNTVLHATVEFSPDGTNYYQEAVEAASTSTITEYQADRVFTGAAASTAYSFRIAIPIADIKRLRIGFHETNETAFGTASVLVVTSGQ